ncbi:MAG: hypothetical protein CSA65_05830 [Proteobacteria bacterium]|nr:MAG: hypothetical protein CSB49_02170 [Pseudomonadota bacterium]PIE18233.1 MAG: hypothetical protein CSA65_05830 [Pseudomonadota bacterium]
MTYLRRTAVFGAVVALLSAGCSDGPSDETPIKGVPGTMASFAMSGPINTPETFYDLPYPSDLRLKEDGSPELEGLPMRQDKSILFQLRALLEQRRGFPQAPAVYFRFDGKLPTLDPDKPYAASTSSPVLLIDIDEGASRGTLYPAIAFDVWPDTYAPKHLLAIGPWRGVVLPPGRRYAAVVLRSLLDAEGKPLGSSAAFEQLKAGRAPAGERGTAAAKLYQPLWETLDTLGVDRLEVAAATVFSTGDVVADLAELSSKLLDLYRPTIDNVKLSKDHPRYCELSATITLPQFQRGSSPFDTEGLFELGADGLPKKQRDEVVPLIITIPKSKMPEAGYPLTNYIHGSGGSPQELVDRGKVEVVGGKPRPGEGPAYVLAPYGIAMASIAKPVNPQRGGTGDFDYLNLSNLAAFRDTFRQGAIEERLFFSALIALRINPATLGSCAPELPSGVTHYKVDASKVALMGQSMGGMYTNMVSAIDERVRAAVPTGAGGFWSYMMLSSSIAGLGEPTIRLVIGSNNRLSWLHPALQVVHAAWETADPLVFVPRLSSRPLSGHPARHVYEPVGKDDKYFPTSIYDAIATAFGHQQAGQEIWPGMQRSLKQVGLDGLVTYPVKENLQSQDDGKRTYTGVVVQYEGDGLYDPHSIAFQLDSVKHQYSCFLDTFFRHGVAAVLAPGKPGDPCE